MSEPSEYRDGAELRFRMEVIERNNAQLAKDVKEGFETIGKNFSTLNDRVNGSGKPNWQVVVATASFCMLAVGGFITIIKTPMENSIARLELTSIEYHNDRRQMLTKEDYHYERDRNFGLISKEIDALDGKIERLRDRQDKDIRGQIK